MKMIVAVALALAAVVAAAPPAPAVDRKYEVVPIVRSEIEMSPEGGYHYSWESGNGINAAASGSLKQVVDEDNKPVNVLVTRGEYSYPGEDGKPISVTYEADENGFRAIGDHIPKP